VPVDEPRPAPGSTLAEFRLFGSKARGDTRADCDLDVLIVVKGERVSAEDLAIDIAFDINVANDLSISPRVASAQSWPIPSGARRRSFPALVRASDAAEGSKSTVRLKFRATRTLSCPSAHRRLGACATPCWRPRANGSGRGARCGLARSARAQRGVAGVEPRRPARRSSGAAQPGCTHPVAPARGPTSKRHLEVNG